MLVASQMMLASRTAVRLLSMSITRQLDQADPHQLHLVRSTGGPCQEELCQLGEFDGPRGIAPLPGGGACVVDGLNDRVQLLDAEGDAVGTIEGLSCPTGVAVHGDRLYISESTGAHRVTCRRLSDGALIGSVGGLGSGDGELHGPQCVAVAGEQLLVAEWGNSRVSVFDRDTMAFVRHIGQTLDDNGDPEGGDAPGQLDEPSDLAVSGDELFVADTWNHRICVFGLTDGAFRRCFGRRGAGRGEFTYPTGIACADGRVYTTERMGGDANRRVQELSLEGAPLQELLPSHIGRRVARRGGQLHGICVDGDRVWVTDSGMHMVHLLTTAEDAYAPPALQVG